MVIYLSNIYTNLGHLKIFAEEMANDTMAYHNELFQMLKAQIIVYNPLDWEIKQHIFDILIIMIQKKLVQKEEEEVRFYIIYIYIYYNSLGTICGCSR